MPALTEVVPPFAAVAMTNITQAYPYASHHVATGPDDDHRPASSVHPAFANSFDWHSSVHMHYLLARLLDTDVPGEWRERAVDLLTAHLGGDNLHREAEFLLANPHWERPYGWAWAVELGWAIRNSGVPEIAALAAHGQQLADAVYALMLQWLPKLPEPVRHGLHTNAAFGFARIRRVAALQGRADVVAAIDAAARRFFLADGAWVFEQERSGQDFLSPGMCEADLMIDVLDDEELREWLPEFMSRLSPDSRILAPAQVLDPTDGYQSHLYGLGLTISASLMRIAPKLRAIGAEAGDAALVAQSGRLEARIPALMAPGLEAALSDEYMSSHWIATFAWEALVLEHAAASPKAD